MKTWKLKNLKRNQAFKLFDSPKETFYLVGISDHYRKPTDGRGSPDRFLYLVSIGNTGNYKELDGETVVMPGSYQPMEFRLKIKILMATIRGLL